MNTENTTELTDTTINIKIRTGVMHRNTTDEAQTRVDYTGFYISAINYFVRVALEAQSHLDIQTDSVVLRNDVKFRENLQFLIQIQEAFAEWLPDYSSEIGRQTENKILDSPAQSGETTDLEKLAAQISEVMKNPLTPERLYNAMTDELISTPYDTDSPEWILKSLEIDNE